VDLNDPRNPQLQEALGQLQEYLSDDIPPLFFANAAQALMEAPPEHVAGGMAAWASGQIKPLPIADYLFHGAKKLHLLGELGLFPKQEIEAFLTNLRPALLSVCPVEDQQSLAADLDRIHLGVAIGGSASVDLIYRTAERSAGPAQATRARLRPDLPEDGAAVQGQSGSVGTELRRLNQLLRRLEVQSPSGAIPVSTRLPGGGNRAVAEVLTQATAGAQNATELQQFLTELQKRGLPATPDGLMKLLAAQVPDWAAPAAEASPLGAVRAMRKFIDLAKDQNEGLARYDELVTTAVHEFNEGSLGRSVTLLDLAERMAADKVVDGAYVKGVQRRGRSMIDEPRLRSFAEHHDHHHLLRRFLHFFPELGPEALLIELEEEENRDRRRYLLALLVAQGDATRRAVLDDLRRQAGGAASFPWYYNRNLVHLLRTIPRPPESDLDPEIDMLVRLSDLKGEMPLVREALTAMGQIQHERVVTALSGRLSELEDGLLGETGLPHDKDQLLALVDNITRSLVRQNHAEARRSLVAHGLRREPALGDTLERLARLSEQDLSGEADLVDRIARALRAELPKKVLGLTLTNQRKSSSIGYLVESLSSTDVPAVRDLLSEIVSDFGGQPFAELAASTLRQLGGPARIEDYEAPAATLSGDLGLFGLPNLLQNLAESQISGLLKVFAPDGGLAAELSLENGKLRRARAGKLAGRDVVYRLLEDPAPGRFVLEQENQAEPGDFGTGGVVPIPDLLFEGIRRFDEFNRAAALAPDGARFKRGATRPSEVGGETDGEFVREVWRRAAAGFSPDECEAELPVDRFRVRRLFEHWIAEGALISLDFGSPGPTPEDSSST
jgi:hypothetical protein